MIVYIDPPYMGTQQYGYSFDVANLESGIWNNCPIYISEGVKLERAKDIIYYLLAEKRKY